MDAFFASIEVREHPELAGQPVIVGGVGNRGVVCSATYQARRFGVRSAMPMVRARRLCPHAVVLPVRGSLYHEVSGRVMATFASITPDVEPLSSDEAFLGIAGAVRRLGSPRSIAESIRRRIAGDEQLTCSVGVASTKFIAKLASTTCKPDGLLVVPTAATLEFLHPLPIDALWGVGERTAERLRAIGLATVGDVAGMPTSRLRHTLGRAAAEHLSALARGHDPRSVQPLTADKSIGAERTFGADTYADIEVHRELLRLSGQTAARLRSSGLRTGTVSVKVRFPDFTTVTRSRTLGEPTDATRELYRAAKDLFGTVGAGRGIRLIGVRAEGLHPARGASRQLMLGDDGHRWRDADRAADRAVARFGAGAVRPASLVDPLRR